MSDLIDRSRYQSARHIPLEDYVGLKIDYRSTGDIYQQMMVLMRDLHGVLCSHAVHITRIYDAYRAYQALIARGYDGELRASYDEIDG